MGQEVRGKAAAPALTGDPERSIGAYLARQRELRGISLEELATLTRIPRRSLERLESGVFDQAPDGFVRGFVRTVAAALGLDPDAAVMRLLAEPAIDADLARRSTAWASPASRGLALGLAGLLAAAALGWLAASWRTGEAAPRADEAVLRRDPIRALALEAEESAREAAERARDTSAAPAAPVPPPQGDAPVEEIP